MKWRLTTMAILQTWRALGQGTFQNLNFEEANPAAGHTLATLFPGWQAFYNSTPVSVVGYDDESTGAALLSIQDDKAGYMPIQGNYTAFLQSAVVGSQSTSVTLSQTGLVPNGTESIELDANEPNGGAFAVTLGGDNISMFPLKTFSGYTLYGGNVSAWAGQDAALNITQMAAPTSNGEYSPSLLELDDITFSPGAVPEPSALALTGIGGLLFALYRRITHRS
jgi:hypothetical protein